MKKIIPLQFAYRLIMNGSLLIVASRGENKRDNIMTAAWSTPLESNPPRLALVIDPAHRTWENLNIARVCTLNIVGRSTLRLARYAGTISGRARDKLAESGALAVMGSVLDVPIFPECLANIECRVLSQAAE
ncbi:MAG: flavin reductase family protein, partial [Spirochaetota bacterium]|nr:flavin reductase family protein [Spirochaetota bacterium]